MSFWIKWAQQQANSRGKFEEDCLHLNVHGNQEGMWECRGRNQGHYPSFCQTPHPSLTHKFTNHMSTLHCVALTMTKVQELYWVPNLRAHMKQVLSTFSLWHWQHRLLYSTHWPYRGKHLLQGYQSLFCRAHQIPYQSQNRRKGLSCVEHIQSYMRIIPERTTKPGNQ